MRNKVIMTALALAFTTLGAQQAVAADATAALDINSAYVWRGLTFNDGLVLQPSMDVSAGGFGFNVWGNFDVDDYDDTLDSNEFSEVDLTASYSHALGPVEVSVGIIEYLFPAGGDSTTELFVGAGYEIGAGFSVSAELYYDIDQVEDYYATLGVGYAIDFNDALGMELGAMISYAGEDFASIYGGGTDSGFFNYGLSAALSYSVSEALSVGVNINVADSVDDDVLPDSSVDTTVYGGASISYSF